jgi:hypothetical protein
VVGEPGPQRRLERLLPGRRPVRDTEGQHPTTAWQCFGERVAALGEQQPHLLAGHHIPDVEAVDAIDQLGDGDATLLGAVGAADIPDDVTLWGLLIPIRREFDQYVNLRPIKILPGVTSPLTDVTELDIVVVRENVEGEYSEIGGRVFRGQPHEAAVQEAVFTRRGIQRVAGYAVEQAARRQRQLISATKSNGIIHTMPFWDEVVRETVASNEADVQLESVLIDALAARLVLKPPHRGRHRRLQSVRRHLVRPCRRRRRIHRASLRAPTSTPHGSTHPCSNPYTAPPPTSQGKGSPTRSDRCGPPR